MNLVLSLVFWGSAFPGIRAALQGYTPVKMAVFRFLIASATLAIIAIFKGVRVPARRFLWLIAMAAFFSIPGYHVCLNFGESHVTASSASLILSTMPILTIFWSRLFLGESFHPVAWIGVLLSFVGAAVIALGEGGGFHFNPYVGFVFLSSVCGSVYSTMQKKLLESVPLFDFNCFVIWLGTLFLLPFSSGLLNQISAASPAATGAVIYLGIFPAALTFLLWASVVKSMPVSRAVTFLYLIPVVATGIGWFWINELPSLLSLVGGALILLGLAISQFIIKKAVS